MKIKFSLRLGLHSSDEEREVPDGWTVQQMRDAYMAESPSQQRRMLTGPKGGFMGEILLNGSRTKLDQPLKAGDHLMLLIVVWG